MTIEDKLDQSIADCKAFLQEMETLKAVISKKEPENVRYRAGAVHTDKPNYWYLNSNGDIDFTADLQDSCDNFRYLMGNYFETSRECQDYKENLITRQKLKDIAVRLDKDVKDQYSTFIIVYNIKLDKIIGCEIQKFEEYLYTDIYSYSPDFFKTALEEIGEAALKKMIKQRF